MPREARGSKGFETYHIVVQGKRTVRLFEENEDKQLYLEKLGKGCAERGAGLIGYCMLADHVHLLIAENEGRISDLMRSVHVMFTDAYRKRYGIVFVAAGLLNFIPVLGGLRHADGFDFPYVNLIVCVMLLIVGLELLLKHMLDKRAGNEEDDA